MAQLHFGTGDSITFGTVGSTGATSGFSKSSISNMAIGDLLVAWIHNQNGTPGTITPPTGWIRYGAAIGNPNGTASRNSGIYYYAIKSQTDMNNLGSTPTWTFSVTTGRVACVVARATGIQLDTIEDSAATTFSTTSAASSLAIAGLTTISATTLLVGGTFHANAASTTSPNTTALLTAFQEYKTAPDGSPLANSGAALGYRNLTSAGATGTITTTLDSNAATLSGELVAFTVGAWTAPAGTNPGVAIKYTSATDTLSSGALYYTSATDTLSTPLEVRPFPTGYASVSAMLASTPFYVAHRGGSANWPEMSLYAYTQSGFWGIGALELSLARTSDGVWFGLHDASLDRTSLGTGGGSGTTLVASAMTWAQVQAYTILPTGITNTSVAAQPYMRWEELMAAYYGSFVIFVDPKVASAYSTELLDMMDAMPGSPTTQFVAKSYGVAGSSGNTTGWAHDSHARGYKSWGYFYQADAANFAAYQGRWDILGMDYTADAPTWASIMSYGKPVIGHIVPDLAGATTALGYGAAGIMASGVQQVVTRTPNPSG
jgi:hypothetical protein